MRSLWSSIALIVWCSSLLADNEFQTSAKENSASLTADAGDDIFLILPANSVSLLGKGESMEGSSITFLWSQLSGPTQLTLTDPTSGYIVLNDLAEGSYLLEFKVTDENGHIAIDQLKVTVSKNAAVQSAIPRYFTPNGDGINDYWEWPQTEVFRKSILMIFDRSGKRVFDTANYDNTWDGKFNGKPLPDDVYFYTIYMYEGENILGSVRIVR